MKKLLTFLLLPVIVFGAAGDIKIDRKNSSDTAWISTIFAKQNSAIFGTDSSGIPTVITTIPSTITWNGAVVAGQYGGTGVANTGKAITLGGNFTTSGAFDSILTLTGSTNVTLPTSGTLLNSATGTAGVTGTVGNVLVNGGTAQAFGAVTLALPSAITGVTTLTGTSGQNVSIVGGNTGGAVLAAFGPDGIVALTPSGVGAVNIGTN